VTTAAISPAFRRLAWPLAGVAALLVIAAAAPLVAPENPVRMDVAHRLAPPSAAHLLGQDEYGRDVLSRLVWGARVSLSVALAATALAALIGIAAGLIGGYFGRVAELLTVRLADIVLSFPPILLALLVVTLLGPGAATLTLVLAILYTPGFARVAYAEVLATRTLDYVEAARALGAKPMRVLFRTVLPNVAGPLLIQFSLTVAAAIVVESGLSFLGLGVVPPAPSWGLMIRGARATMEQNPLGLLWPCLALVLAILAINRLCDALRDSVDPRTAGRARHIVSARRVAPTIAETVASHEPALLTVTGLRTEIATQGGIIRAVDDVSFEVHPRETLAIVGESGSGKSMLGLSIMRLLPEPAAQIVAGGIALATKSGGPRDLARLDETALRRIRGDDLAMVFQEPMTSLNPVYRIGDQIAEAIRQHRRIGARAALRQAEAMLTRVGIADPKRRLADYPHRLSGGMRQRAMIAIALACDPKLLIADEPTTALDVTVQAQIVELLRRLQREQAGGMGMLFITHNLGVVAGLADRVLVMYAGRVVEEGEVRALFAAPKHPYTAGLLGSIRRPPPLPSGAAGKIRLQAIPGTVPDPLTLPAGCSFAPRCALAIERCREEMPVLRDVAPGRRSRCHRWEAL
jgi:peptide/nickel transport system permease protein